MRLTNPVVERPPESISVTALDSLDDICGWLGTFQVRLKVAHEIDRAQVAAAVADLQARYKQRRAELA